MPEALVEDSARRKRHSGEDLYWIARLAEEIAPDPSLALALHRECGAFSDALEVAARAGRLEEMAELAEAALQHEIDPTHRAALCVLVGETRLDLKKRAHAMEGLFSAQDLFPDERRVTEALAIASFDGDAALEIDRFATTWGPLSGARLLHVSGATPDRCEALLREALTVEAQRAAALRLLEARFVEVERWDDLAALHTDAAAHARDPIERARLCRRFVLFWHERTPERAAMFARWLAAPGDPDFPAGILLARRILGERGEHASLVELCNELQNLDEDERALAMFVADEARAWVEAKVPLGDEQRKMVEHVRELTRTGAPVDKLVEAWRRAITIDPSAREPRRELAVLLRKAERWRALADALRDEEQHACRAAVEKIAVLHELATVYRERLHQDLLVVGTLGRVLEIDPGNFAALDRLAVEHESHKRWTDLVALHHKRVQLAGDDAHERAALLVEVGRVQLERMGNEAEAVRTFEAALEATPPSMTSEAIDPLRGLYEKRREWEKLVTLRRRAHQTAPNLDEALEIARLSEKAKRAPLSIEAWEEVRRLDPDSDEALAALEKLYEREKRWPELAAVCARLAERAGDEAKQAAAWQKLGTLYGEKLDDEARAAEAWRRLLALQPESLRAQDALKKLYVAARKWEELDALLAARGRLDDYLRVLEKQIDLEDDATKLELLGRLAVVFRDRLGRNDRAQRTYERMLGLDSHNLVAAEGLIPLYATGDPKKLVGVLAVQLEHTREPLLRRERLERIAALQENAQGDKPAAFASRLTAFDEDPSIARDGLERLANETSGWAALVQAYARAAEKLPPAEALELHVTAARLREERLNDTDGALAAWRRVLALDGDHAAALEALERLHLAAGRHDELLAIYQRRLLLAPDPATRRAVRLKIGQLAEEVLRDDATALATYEDILVTDGEQPEVLAALERLHARAQAWPKLADVLERERALLPDGSARDEVKLRLAEVRETQLGDVSGAIALYREVLERTPLDERARAGLGRHLRGPHQLEAARILQPIFERAHEWERLIESYHVLATDADGTRLVEIWRAVGMLLEERLERPEEAFAAMGRALHADPADDVTYRFLERLAGKLGAWEPLATLYREIASHPLSIDLQVRLRCRLGQLYRRRLGLADRAVATFSRILDLDGHNREALAALAGLQRELGHADEAAALEKRLLEEMRNEPDGISAPLSEVRSLDELRLFARMYLEELDRPTQAIATWRRVLALDPSDTEAFLALEKLLRDDELLALLAARHAAAPDDLETSRKLEVIYRREQQFAELVPLLRVRVAKLEDPVARVAALLEIARLHEEELGDARGAFKATCDAYRLDGSEAICGELERRASTPEEWEAVIREEQRHAERLEGERGKEAADRWVRVARLYDEQLYAIEEALQIVRVVEALDRDHKGALDLRISLLQKKGDWGELGDALAHRARVEEDAPLRAMLFLSVADLREVQEHDYAGAIEAYSAALEAEPGNGQALHSLEHLYRKCEMWPELAEILRVRAGGSEVEEALARLEESAALFEEKIGDADKAIEVRCAMLQIDPQSVEALRGLERLYAETGAVEEYLAILEHELEVLPDEADAIFQQMETLFRGDQNWEALADTYRRHLLGVEDPGLRLELRCALAEVYELELRDLEGAREAWNEVLADQPDEPRALAAITRLAPRESGGEAS